MNTSFASSVQHSGRKNKYPAVKSALLLLLLFFLVFRWWIVHQEVGTELHFSRWRYTYIHTYIYVHSRRTRSFRIPFIGRIKFVHGRNGLRFLKLRWSTSVMFSRVAEEGLPSPFFFPHFPPLSPNRTPFSRVYVPPLYGGERGGRTNVSFSRRKAAACGELDRAANEASLGLVTLVGGWSSG